jgi:hypothetical protein
MLTKDADFASEPSPEIPRAAKATPTKASLFGTSSKGSLFDDRNLDLATQRHMQVWQGINNSSAISSASAGLPLRKPN